MATPIMLAAMLILTEASDATNTVDLGGIRKASASVRIEGDSYVIALRMLSVKCFDTATNARVNRDKGELYCLQAIMRYLGGKDEAATATVSGVVIRQVATEGKFYCLTISIPRQQVRLSATVGREPIPKAGAREGNGGNREKRSICVSSLLTRKQDYLATLHSLSQMICEDADAIVVMPKGEQLAAFIAIADLEERWEKSAAQLIVEARADRLLLTVENEDVSTSTSEEGKRVLQHLRTISSQIEAAASKEAQE
jgi:hypothetical protein